MNKPTLFFISFILFSLHSFAQSAKSDTTLEFIEKDILKANARIMAFIDSGYHYRDYDDTLSVNKMLQYIDDSVSNADDILTFKIMFYARCYPKTIQYDFKPTQKGTYFPIGITTSSDENFRIYSWDDMLGGTARFNINVFQYMVSGKTYSCMLKDADSMANNNDYISDEFDTIYTFQSSNNIYYLATTYDRGSTRDREEGIIIFTIKSGKLSLAPIIKRDTVMTDNIWYEYDFFAKNAAHSIYFNHTNNTIYVPIIENNERVTSKYDRYHFNGKYFEKVNK